MKYKKGIGPVIATALLVMISIVAVVTFQGWYGIYSSQILTQTETKSDIKTSRI